MNLLFLIMLFPLLGFVILSVSQGKWSKTVVSNIGIGSIGISACVTTYVIICYFYQISKNNIDDFIFSQKLWTWFFIDPVCINVSLRLDWLSLILLSVIIGVGLVIHIYSAWYMQDREGYSRFFAYTNLFMFNMILLVLSDNLLLMYFGWEGVGLCSYLLIGFYYFNSSYGIASLKAFIVTRFGDVFLVCAMFLIYDCYHTFDFNKLCVVKSIFSTSNYFLYDSNTWISFMLLIGAIGKSAQLPLHTWLINAMVGPTPVSALIHAATMVISGVYLIIRMNNFFLMTPDILYLTGIIGALTIVMFSCSALFQSDLKKILAYSTISQIGYMFLSIGIGYWNAAICHLITHAFFKALLFLSAGLLINMCKREQNIFNLGGLYKSIPLIYVCFLVGGASLSALPVVTAGFYSKGMILSKVLESENYFLFFSGLLGVFLTSVYTFRMIFIIFHGYQKIQFSQYSYQIKQIIPLAILLVLSTFVGGLLAFFLTSNTTTIQYDKGFWNDNTIYCELVSGILVILGIWISFVIWGTSIHKISSTIYISYYSKLSKIKKYFVDLCFHGWGFERFYYMVFVLPCVLLVNKLSRYDPSDFMVKALIKLFFWFRWIFAFSINGKLNWYIISINVGTVIILIFLIICHNVMYCTLL